MTDFRIVKIVNGERIHYEIQEKQWFIFFYWETLNDWDCDHLGIVFENSMKFDTMEKAEKYLKRNNPQTKTIVKYITL